MDIDMTRVTRRGPRIPIVLGVPRGTEDQSYVPTGAHVARVRERARDLGVGSLHGEVDGSEFGGLNVNLNSAEFGPPFASENQTEIGPGVASINLRGSGRKNDGCPNGPQIDAANLVAHDDIQPNTDPAGVLKNPTTNVNNFAANVPKSTWASLFGTATEGSLPYTLPKAIGDKIVVIPTEEVIDQGIRVWENSLVGQLIDAKLPYSVIQRLVEKICGKIEMPIITILENDLICFQFRRSKSVEWILSRGPWHLGGKPMLFRKWTPAIVPESFVFNSVPVWITLGKLPMELWTEAGLAVVAGAVGKPISLDLATKERRRLSYARVCVELEGGSNMPSEITVNLRGVEFNVSVNYEWKPRKCNLCGAFGHSSSKCSRSEESKTIQEEVVHKGDDVYSEPCGEVVLEAFKQLEEGE
ncbi:DUF4283 domain-containing protein [Cucumis melo var. makuwa]|uniref:DUF4283 domain-containing protein n=1 Tax=Cucumis melo var. makuwa TaxID=1194695 RepID=A0A5D3DSG9_CUCMM|nr:DUF4283 domain-containing protein [Cucumis melo var. makuwa]